MILSQRRDAEAAAEKLFIICVGGSLKKWELKKYKCGSRHQSKV